MTQFSSTPSTQLVQLGTAQQSAISDLETAVGTYGGGADIATDLATLVTAVGTYSGGEADIGAAVDAAETNIGTPATVSTETDLFAICAALEARIVALEGA